LEYLQLLATAFDQTAGALLNSWVEGVNGYPPYREEFVAAGEGSTAYPTPQTAAEEIVQGIMGILDELANAKIDEPLQTQNPFLLESRFSNSSLRDFEFNLLSAQNAYLGQVPDARTSGRSLSEFVASVDPDLDTQIQQEMQAAFAAIEAIPGPIEKTLCEPEAIPKISSARDSVLTLFELFEQRVLPLAQN
jgi:predicted lipoprotein